MAVVTPRAIFKGVLKVSMAAIPIAVMKGTESADRDTTLHQIHIGCGGAVGRQNICKKDGTVVESADIGRAVNGVPVDEALLDSFKVESDKAIDVKEFVPLASIDLRLFDEPRYIVPEKGGADALRAFADTMLARAEAGKPVAAVGKIAEKERERVVALYVIPVDEREDKPAMVLHMLRWPEAVRDATFSGEAISEGRDVTEQLRGGVNALIDAMSTEAFDPASYVDEKGRARTEALAAIAAGGTVQPGREPSAPTASVDLMAALKASIEAATPKVSETKPKAKAKSKN